MSRIDRIRALCLALPEAFELETWERATFRVGGGRGKIFCIAALDGASLTLKADPLEREAVIDQGEPYFIPPYVGHKGWVGIHADHQKADWDEVAELIATSYCLVAPKRLARTVTGPPTVG